MDNLINDIKVKNKMVIWAMTGFFILVTVAEYLDLPRSYTDTILKGNPTYYDNFKEAFYLRERGLDPYSTSHYFSQNYLLFWVLYQIRNYGMLMKAIHLIFIVSNAVLLGQILGGPRRYRTTIMALLLVNPVTVHAHLTQIYFYNEQVMTYFNFTMIILPIYILVVRRKFLTSAFLFGLLLYLNPRALIFISVIAQTFSERGKLNKRSLLFYSVLALSLAILLFAMTDIVTGKDGVV